MIILIEQLNLILGRSYNYNLLGDYHGVGSLDYEYILALCLLAYVFGCLVKGMFAIVRSLWGGAK